MRQSLKDQNVGLDPHFRYRGLSQTRIETFSDIAFALAITLLVLSSSVPNSFEALRNSMKDVLPFGMCIALIALIWYQHYVYFLRYGLQSVQTVVANTILLFLILVYVYPLKFLMRFLSTFYSSIFSGEWADFTEAYGSDIDPNDISYLMVIYGLGAALIFLCLAWLYWFALKQKVNLALDEYELFQTRTSLKVNLLMAAIPLSSVFATYFLGANSGLIYFLYPIVMTINGVISGRKKKKLLAQLGLNS